MQRRIARALLLVIPILVLLALPAAGQTEDDGWLLEADDDSVLVGIQRDIAVGPTERIDAVVVTNGEALIEGNVETLLAIDAEVTVSGSTARVERLFAITGTLTAADGATLGDTYHTDTELAIDEASVTIEGEFVDAREELAGALGAAVAVLIVVVLFLIVGVVIASLALTLLVIAFGTDQTRRAAATIGHDVLKVIVVGLLMTVIPGLVFALLFVTIVGIPLALVLIIIWGVVAFLGQVVVATWIGERILPRGRTANRPYGAAFLGMVILLLLSWTGVVPLLAGIFGTGAVTLAGWRVLRSGGHPPLYMGYGGQPYGQPMQVAPPPYAPPPYAPPPPQGPWPPQGGQPPSSWPQG